MRVDNAGMASPNYVYPWRGRHPLSMTWRNNWKTVETRSLDKKHPEGGKEKELDKCKKHLLHLPLPSAWTCKWEWWLSCCLMVSMHEHVLIFIKLDSYKEQDSQVIRKMIMQIWLQCYRCFVSCLQDMTAKRFWMAIRNVSARMFTRWATFDNNKALQEWVHHVQ